MNKLLRKIKFPQSENIKRFGKIAANAIKRDIFSLVVCLFFILILCFCYYGFIGYEKELAYGPSKQLRQSAHFIHDTDVANAQKTGILTVSPVRVAWYSLNDSSESILHKMMDLLHLDVLNNVVIPESYANTFSENYFVGQGVSPNTSHQVDLMGLRFCAAQKKINLLVIVSSRFKETRKLNRWKWLNIAILPIPFTPFFSNTYEYSADALLIDVRTGYFLDNLHSVEIDTLSCRIKKLAENSKSEHEKLRHSVSCELISNLTKYLHRSFSR